SSRSDSHWSAARIGKMTDLTTGREHVRAEDEHAVPQVRLPPSLLQPSGSAQAPHGREELGEFGFRIASLLSETEGSALVVLAEQQGFKSIKWEYDPVRDLLAKRAKEIAILRRQ